MLAASFALLQSLFFGGGTKLVLTSLHVIFYFNFQIYVPLFLSHITPP